MTLQDSFSRWTEIFPCTSNTAMDTARCLAKFITRWGVTPEILSSDRGTHFVNAVIQKMCLDLKIEHKIHCAWRPESSGGIERAHRTIKNALYSSSYDNGNTWLDNVLLVQQVLNSCKNAVTQVSPFYCIFGRPYELPQLPQVPDSLKSVSDPGLTLAKRLANCHRAVQVLNEAADEAYKQKNNVKFDSSELQVGQEVLIYRPLSAEAKSTKMPWVGPYRVLQSNELTAKLQNPRNQLEDYVRRDHIRPLVARPAHLEDSDDESCDENVESGGPVCPITPMPKLVQIRPLPPPKTEPGVPTVKPEPPAPTVPPVPPEPPKSTTATAPAQSSDSLRDLFKNKRLKPVNRRQGRPSTPPASNSGTPPSSTAAPPRRSGRNRRQVEKLTVDPKSKVYR